MAQTVRYWMTHPVVTAKPRDTIAHARAVMIEHRVNQLPVLAGSKLVGIITDRDVRDAYPSVAQAGHDALGDRLPADEDPERIPVEDVLTADVLTVGPEAPIVEVADTMRRERIGAVPVVEHGHLVGILARSDLLRALVALCKDR